MIGKLLSFLFGPSNRQHQRGIPVEETDEGRLFAILAKDKCPDCGHKGFYEGPHGGMSVNMFCANRECRQGFNITPVVEMAQRIHKADISTYPKDDKHGKTSHYWTGGTG